jgi:hypothetical protein
MGTVLATLEELVVTIANVEGLGTDRVRAIARAVREAGLIATGGRGNWAAKMSERDAANLLIAVNVADTARVAPRIVERYRGLRARSATFDADFGAEFEKLLRAARTRTMANFVASLVRLAPGRSPLASTLYDAEDYEMEIRFKKPTPGVTIYVAAPREEITASISFYERREGRPTAVSDLVIGFAISQRTIFAVGKLLRGGRGQQRASSRFRE